MSRLLEDFLIFSMVASAFTIVALILLALRSQPRIELVMMWTLAVLWVAMGAYTTDIIGHVECDSLEGTVPAARGRRYSYRRYCREVKAIEAFSWTNFGLFALFFLLLLRLILQYSARGYKAIWSASVSELGWFDEELQGNGAPQYYQTVPAGGQTYTYPNVTTFGNSQPVYQLPGHSVVITNGPNGRQIAQVPVGQAPPVTPQPTIGGF
ncbi:uncharacterized protein EI90DRAFT_1729629 [Cantharellus anzutake]|uniref:uncharacterized protein n=1 Tax=Cantharellus anzutake TaxID=1750568 RepID=UPI001903519F|nr:uncharacterized protein EI90DRAFT_1729629 [Cantharellus anzutake]KAF8341382.1 hypothetical protein EI90DRAFT_1729629 [Cantharellus anzutake]